MFLEIVLQVAKQFLYRIKVWTVGLGKHNTVTPISCRESLMNCEWCIEQLSIMIFQEMGSFVEANYP